MALNKRFNAFRQCLSSERLKHYYLHIKKKKRKKGKHNEGYCSKQDKEHKVMNRLQELGRITMEDWKCRGITNTHNDLSYTF